MPGISIFETRTMLAALKQMRPATTFLLDTFFPSPPVTHLTENIDIDIVDKTGRKMAPFVSPRMEGKVIKKSGYKTRSYKAPYIKEKTITTASDLLTREAGSTIYTDDGSMMLRAARRLGEDLAELRELITRRMEWMAAQLLETGTVVIKGDGIDDEIDFQMKATHLPVLSGTALWTVATSDPIKDLEDWAEMVGQDSGVYPTDTVMGSDVYQAFRKHPLVLAYLDNRRIEIGQMAPRPVSPGVHFVFRLESAGINIWTYSESYFDDETETLKKFVPANKLFMGSRDAYTRKHFGVIKDVEGLAAVPFYPKTWVEKDPSAQILLLQSAPLVALHQVDAFLCAQPVA